MYDLIIIGGGPAAVGAGVYAARKKLKTLLITESFGGQSLVSDKIENWIGETAISGLALAQKLENHLRAHQAIEIKEGERVQKVEATNDFSVRTDQGSVYTAKAIVVASGARRRRLGIPGEDTFEGKGVAFCSTCDAPLFSRKDVAVVGAGNAGLEAVIDLFPYANKIYLIVRGETLKGDVVIQEEIKKNQKVSILYHAEPREILGDKFVTGLAYLDSKENTTKTLAVGGVFVEIGSVPNSEMIKGLAEVNPYNEIVIDHRTGKTSHPGIFAAGDVTDDLYKQNNISVGDGIAAALSAYNYLLQRKKVVY